MVRWFEMLRHLARRAGLLGACLFALPPGVGATDGGWQTIADPPPIAVGADGRPHAASCSGYPGTDPGFRFWVRQGDPTKLAVVFDGGGACWDDLTCSNPFGGDGVLTFYSPDIPPGSEPTRYGGLLDFANPANPVRDWTVVAIPYCTADVHLGSTDRGYTMKGHPGLPRQFTLHHRGYDNFMVVLDWITRHVPQGVSDLLVTRRQRRRLRRRRQLSLAGAGLPAGPAVGAGPTPARGVSTAGFDAGTPGRGSWNPQLAPLGLRAPTRWPSVRTR
jgi:hypothetical protein